MWREKGKGGFVVDKVKAYKCLSVVTFLYGLNYVLLLNACMVHIPDFSYITCNDTYIAGCHRQFYLPSQGANPFYS